MQPGCQISEGTLCMSVAIPDLALLESAVAALGAA